jgi:ABC-2 type transport system permease protein
VGKETAVSGFLYMRFELLRAFRNRRFLILSFGFPLVLYFLIAGSQRNTRDLAGSGIPAPLYYMAGLAAFGTMASMISSGARIAAERQAGWTRQLRITPLTPRAYFRAKVVSAYAMAITSLLLLYLAGASLGVSLAVHQWLSMTGLILIALLPFAALGISLGHVMNVDSVGPLTGGLVAILAFLAGTWFPLTHGFLYDVGQYIPGYWIVQASHIALHGHGWSTKGWVVVIVWAIVLVVLARVAYRRDTQRV